MRNGRADQLLIVTNEINRLRFAIKQFEKAESSRDEEYRNCPCAEFATIKRASMDLTRELSNLRRPNL